MKTVIYSLFICCMLFILSCSAPQNTNALADRSFKVWGNCDQCKEAIEEAAAVPGVSNPSWNEESTLLTFKIDTTLATDDTVLKAVAAAGYDNARYSADDKAYGNLPECCQYKRKQSAQ